MTYGPAPGAARGQSLPTGLPPRALRRARYASQTLALSRGLLVWGLVGALSWSAYLKAPDLHPAARWIAILHPVLFALTAWPVLCAYWRKGRWLTIGNAVLVLVYVYMGLGAITFVSQYDHIELSTLRLPEHSLLAMIVVIVGTLAFRLGAEWFRLHPLVRRFPALPPTPPWSFALRLGVLASVLASIGVDLLYVSLGFFGWGGNVLQSNLGVLSFLEIVGNCGLIGLSIGFYYLFRGQVLKAVDRSILFGAVFILMSFALLHGMKSAVFDVIIAVGVPYVILRASGRSTFRIPRLPVIAMGVFVVLLFAVNPLYRLNLARIGSEANRLQVASEAVEMTVRDVSSTGDRTLLMVGLDELRNRTSLFGFLLAALDRTPRRIEFRKWDRYPTMLAIAFIPRFLWESKPLAREGLHFTRNYVTYYSDNSTTPSVFGWAYIEDGWLGVVVLLFLLGCTIQVLQLYSIDKHGATLPAVVLFMMGIRLMFTIEADPFWVFAGMPKALLTILFGYWVIVTFPRLLLRPRSLPAR